MRPLSHRASLLAASLLALTGAPGCMFLEVSGGYYFGGAEKGEKAPASTPTPEADSGFGGGVKLGFMVDIPNDEPVVRVGAGAGYDFLPSAGVVEFPEINLAVTVKKLDSMRIRAMAAVAGMGAGKIGVAAGEPDISAGAGVFAGAAAQFGEKGDENVMLAGGFRYIKVKSDGDTLPVQSVTQMGPEIRLILNFNGGSSSGGGGGGGGGDVNGWVTDFDSDPTDVMAGMAVGAKNRGCDVSVGAGTVIMRCAEGNVVLTRKGNSVVTLCQQGLAISTCRAIISDVAEYAKRAVR